MAYAWGILAGVCGAILAVLIWIAASVSIDFGTGASAATVVVDSGSIALAALVGFIAGFWLHRLRTKRRRR